MRSYRLGAVMLVVMFTLGLLVTQPALAEEKPVIGGILRVAIAGDPPTLDMHQEQTFKVLIPMSTVYNTLVRFDPHGFPKIIGDLAESWTVSEDHKTYTFKVHQGVKFHDGGDMTAADVVASFEKIIFPVKGTDSRRRTYFRMVESIELIDRYTMAFHLKYPSGSFLSFVAHPAMLIYAKRILDKDMNWHKLNTNGTGPFKFKKWVRGSYLEVERFDDYFRKPYPYLDGAKYFMIKDLSARAKSVRSGRTDVEFRGLPPSEVDAMKMQMGDKITVRTPKAMIHWGVIINSDHKPFDDARVRKALTLAIDRYAMANVLRPLSGLETVGGMIHPDAEWALPPEDLQKLPGFGRDHAANVKEAKRLLAEAGYPKGFKMTLMNRAVKLPYIDFGVYLISAWKKIGIETTHKLEESAAWSKARRTRDFQIAVEPYGSAATGDPDEMMERFTTGASQNYSRFSVPEADKLFEMQKVEIDPAKRIEQVQEMQRLILAQAWFLPGLWWNRLEVRSSRIKNYEPHHNHWMNRRLEDVWMTKK